MKERWLRHRLRQAAIQYAGHDWPVIPGAFLVRDRYLCGPLCPTVGCHPAIDDWQAAATTDPQTICRWWGTAAYSILLATGSGVDAFEVPARLGQRIMTLATDRAALGPVVATPAGQWIFLVEPGERLCRELADRHEVIRHGTGSWIPVPPARTPGGRLRWQVRPGATRWRLADPYRLQRLLVTQLARLGRPPTFSARTDPLSRVA